MRRATEPSREWLTWLGPGSSSQYTKASACPLWSRTMNQARSLRSSMAREAARGTRSRQEARLGLQPLTDYAGMPLTIGWPILRKNIVDDVI